eukprot:GILK01009643.1.p1 GENE.GILK01009643.1~~GILK01009643.1.p1  ORF type:complete len:1711 (-),score=140.75 GILK01009643.1:12-5117(-)
MEIEHEGNHRIARAVRQFAKSLKWPDRVVLTIILLTGCVASILAGVASSFVQESNAFSSLIKSFVWIPPIYSVVIIGFLFLPFNPTNKLLTMWIVVFGGGLLAITVMALTSASFVHILLVFVVCLGSTIVWSILFTMRHLDEQLLSPRTAAAVTSWFCIFVLFLGVFCSSLYAMVDWTERPRGSKAWMQPITYLLVLPLCSVMCLVWFFVHKLFFDTSRTRASSVVIFLSGFGVMLGMFVYTQQYLTEVSFGEPSQFIMCLCLLVLTPICLILCFPIALVRLDPLRKFCCLPFVGVLVPVGVAAGLLSGTDSSESRWTLLVLIVGFPLLSVLMAGLSLISIRTGVLQRVSAFCCILLLVPIGVLFPLYEVDLLPLSAFLSLFIFFVSIGTIFLSWSSISRLCRLVQLKIWSTLKWSHVVAMHERLTHIFGFVSFTGFCLGIVVLLVTVSMGPTNSVKGMVGSLLFVCPFAYLLGHYATTTSTTNSGRQNKMQLRKIAVCSGIALPLLVLVPVGYGADLPGDARTAVKTLVPGIILPLIFSVMLLQIRQSSAQLGAMFVSALLSCCWWFVFLPFAILIPCIAAWGLSGDRFGSKIINTGIGVACMLCMCGVSIGAMVLNFVYKRLEAEKRAKYTCHFLRKDLRHVGVRSEPECCRCIYDLYEEEGVERSKRWLQDQTEIGWISVDDSDPDYSVSKELVPVHLLRKWEEAEALQEYVNDEASDKVDKHNNLSTTHDQLASPSSSLVSISVEAVGSTTLNIPETAVKHKEVDALQSVEGQQQQVKSGLFSWFRAKTGHQASQNAFEVQAPSAVSKKTAAEDPLLDVGLKPPTPKLPVKQNFAMNLLSALTSASGDEISNVSKFSHRPSAAAAIGFLSPVRGSVTRKDRMFRLNETFQDKFEARFQAKRRQQLRALDSVKITTSHPTELKRADEPSEQDRWMALLHRSSLYDDTHNAFGFQSLVVEDPRYREEWMTRVYSRYAGYFRKADDRNSKDIGKRKSAVGPFMSLADFHRFVRDIGMLNSKFSTALADVAFVKLTRQHVGHAEAQFVDIELFAQLIVELSARKYPEIVQAASSAEEAAAVSLTKSNVLQPAAVGTKGRRSPGSPNQEKRPYDAALDPTVITTLMQKMFESHLFPNFQENKQISRAAFEGLIHAPDFRNTPLGKKLFDHFMLNCHETGTSSLVATSTLALDSEEQTQIIRMESLHQDATSISNASAQNFQHANGVAIKSTTRTRNRGCCSYCPVRCERWLSRMQRLYIVPFAHRLGARLNTVASLPSRCARYLMNEFAAVFSEVPRIDGSDDSSDDDAPNQAVEEVKAKKARRQAPEWSELVPFVFRSLELHLQQSQRVQKEDLSIKMRGSNLVALANLVLEFFTMINVAFRSTVNWNISNSTKTAVEVSLFEIENAPSEFSTFFWLSFTLGCLYALLAVPALKHVRNGTFGAVSAGNKPKTFSKMFFLSNGLVLLGSTLYIPVIKSLVSALACNYGASPWVVYRTSLTCWSGLHYLYVCAAIIGVLVYYPISTFMYPNFQFKDKSLDLKFDTTFLIFLAQGKLIIAGLVSFFPSSQDNSLQLSASMVVYAILALLNWYMKPCIVKRVNTWRSGSFCAASWACFMALLVVHEYNALLPMIFLFIGWFLIFLVCFTLHVKRYGIVQRFNHQAEISVPTLTLIRDQVNTITPDDDGSIPLINMPLMEQRNKLE